MTTFTITEIVQDVWLGRHLAGPHMSERALLEFLRSDLRLLEPLTLTMQTALERGLQIEDTLPLFDLLWKHLNMATHLLDGLAALLRCLLESHHHLSPTEVGAALEILGGQAELSALIVRRWCAHTLPAPGRRRKEDTDERAE